MAKITVPGKPGWAGWAAATAALLLALPVLVYYLGASDQAQGIGTVRTESGTLPKRRSVRLQEAG